MDPELKKKVEQSIFPTPGSWKSRGSEKEIADMESVLTRKKITCKWELSKERLQRKAKFDHSNSKSMKNQYVSLEPLPKEKFECINVLIRDASVQTTGKMANMETQTDVQIKVNNCIESIAVKEELFQLQSLPNLNDKLKDFLKKHVPNLIEQLQSNMLYDLLRNDYKELKNKNKNSISKLTKDIKSIHFYKTPASKKQSVSCHTWHPTIPGVFAISYMANSNAVKKTINLDSAEVVIESNIKYMDCFCDIDNKKLSHKKKNTKKIKVIENYDDSMIKQANTPQLSDEYFVNIWSIDDKMFPKLTLSSPEEVCCVKFNPRNGNTVVGGLMNGQICIWDISGKLDKMDSNNFIMSNNEKKHHRHLWIHMQQMLTFVESVGTKIRATALSAVFESHDSMVTEIQWIHPMNEVTSLGKLVAVKEEQFSDQFFSASSDGTIKLWDLKSTPMPESEKKIPKNTRFPHPAKLDSHKSRLRIYNNRLKPLYTLKIVHPETDMCIPITAMSFEIPLMQYVNTSNQPLIIGTRQFEYAPIAPSEPNRIFVVGNIFGQVGVVTWNGYDKYEPDHNKEKCKNIWWGHVHEGPITCIIRNVFYPDIHLVSGGHVVSIWSVNYEDGPIWWKRFTDIPNSVLWSNNHPAEFRVSFNTSGVLQFWNFMKYYNMPYYELNDIYVTNDRFKGTLSTPNPSVHYIKVEELQYSQGISEVLDYKINETIAFSDTNGMISVITVDTTVPKKDEIEEVGNLFRKVVDARHEVDMWNKNYIELLKENDIKNAKKMLDNESKKCADTEEMKQILDDLDSFEVDYENEKEKLINWIQNNPVKELEWEKIIELEAVEDEDFKNNILKISTMKKLVAKYNK